MAYLLAFCLDLLGIFSDILSGSSGPALPAAMKSWRGEKEGGAGQNPL